MRQRARTDDGHKAIVQALRKVGCQVFDSSRAGQGFPDLVVRAPMRWCTGKNNGGRKDDQTFAHIVLMEVKTARGKLTADQQKFIAQWPEVVIVRSVSEALAAVGVGEGRG